MTKELNLNKMKFCQAKNILIFFNSFGAIIGHYSRLALVDCYCRLWLTQANVMTSLTLHVKVVSLNHFKVNSVSIESARTPGGVVLEGF